ncbi:hypothetical protein PQR79_03570 [Shewanella sp. ER-Te-42B-Light]|uniref:Uncharacterized protein n=1 Tax=Shewanella metallivivens TaxID=2872342 RepID=A0ABT5THX9_9GAMM|nr:hypothetical protein [Shewanella metallivivens]
MDCDSELIQPIKSDIVNDKTEEFSGKLITNETTKPHQLAAVFFIVIWQIKMIQTGKTTYSLS